MHKAWNGPGNIFQMAREHSFNSAKAKDRREALLPSGSEHWAHERRHRVAPAAVERRTRTDVAS